MNRAFVKEPDGDQVLDEAPELPISPHPNYVTPAGLAALKQRLATEERMRDQLVGQEDLAHQPQIAQLDREIRYLEARIQSAIPIDLSRQPRDQVAFGARVTLVEPDDTEITYQIVGEDEADPQAGKISYVSPLAQAIADARIGDVVTWMRPAGDMDLEVVKIVYPSGRQAAGKPAAKTSPKSRARTKTTSGRSSAAGKTAKAKSAKKTSKRTEKKIAKKPTKKPTKKKAATKHYGKKAAVKKSPSKKSLAKKRPAMRKRSAAKKTARKR